MPAAQRVAVCGMPRTHAVQGVARSPASLFAHAGRQAASASVCRTGCPARSSPSLHAAAPHGGQRPAAMGNAAAVSRPSGRLRPARQDRPAPRGCAWHFPSAASGRPSPAPVLASGPAAASERPSAPRSSRPMPPDPGKRLRRKVITMPFGPACASPHARRGTAPSALPPPAGFPPPAARAETVEPGSAAIASTSAGVARSPMRRYRPRRTGRSRT